MGGTPEYASPELLAGGITLDARSDIWSLGHIIRKLFPGRFKGIVRRCLQPDRNRRFRDVEALQGAFRLHRTACRGAVVLTAGIVLAVALFLMKALIPGPAVAPDEDSPVGISEMTVTAQDTIIESAEQGGILSPVRSSSVSRSSAVPSSSVPSSLEVPSVIPPDTSRDSLFTGLLRAQPELEGALRASGRMDEAAAFFAFRDDMVRDGLRYRVLQRPQGGGASGTVQLTMRTKDSPGKTLPVPAVVHVNGANYNVVSIAFGAFSSDADLRMLQLPGTVGLVGQSAFSNSGLDSLAVAGRGMKKIGDGAFSGCAFRSLHLALAEGGQIGVGAFGKCASLAEVSLEGLSRLDFRAFADCPSLEEVSLPETLQQIGVSAFSRCSRLRLLRLSAIRPPVILEEPSGSTRWLQGCDGAALRILVPAESLDAYRSAPFWSDWTGCFQPQE